MPATQNDPRPSIDPDAAMVDHRIIAFRPSVLRAAIEATGLGRLGIPPGTMISAEPVPEEAAIRIRYGTTAEITERMVTAQEIGAILIAYCVGARIPLPMRATKVVSVVRGGVMLDFLTTVTRPPRYQRLR